LVGTALHFWIGIYMGATKRVRPVRITALTAILGPLPAALSTRIGAETARRLAIVVVDGMAVTLLFDRYLMPVLYSTSGCWVRPCAASPMPRASANVTSASSLTT
jgi:Cu/Ag efflux pump CusA